MFAFATITLALLATLHRDKPGRCTLKIVGTAAVGCAPFGGFSTVGINA